MERTKLLEKYFLYRTNLLKSEPINLEELIYLEMRDKAKMMKTSLPIAIGLKITDKCNFKCEHCFVEKKVLKDMSMKVVKDILDGFGNSLPYRIYLTGGEPFLNPNIMDIIKVIKEKHIFMSIHTNGSLLTEEIVKQLKQFFTSKDYLQISVDAADDKLFEEIRRGGNLFEIICNCQKLKSAGIRFILNTVVSNKNVDGLREVYKLAEHIGAEQINFSPLMDLEFVKNIFLPSDGDLLNAFLDVLEYHFNSGCPVKIKQDPLPVPWGNNELNPFLCKSPLICAAGKTEAEIDMYGNMYLCPFLYESEFCMGNVLEQGLKKVWQNEKFVTFSRKKWSENILCKSCNSYDTCNSGCIAYAIRKNMDCDGRCTKQLVK
ncbi:radical SAM protein [Roseburia hominis]